MSTTVQDVLEKFEQLSITERKKVASNILRETLDIETPDLTDDELVLNAEEIFLEQDRVEIDKFKELVKKYSSFVEFQGDYPKDWVFKLEQDIAKEQQNFRKLWEFYHRLRLTGRKENSQEYKDSQRKLNAGFDEWVKNYKENLTTENISDKTFESLTWLDLYSFAAEEFENAKGRIRANKVWRIGNSRVSLDSVIYSFHEGASAEEIALRFTTLDLKQIYSAINFYLQNETEVENYLARRQTERDRLKNVIESRYSPAGIRQKLLERSQNKK